MMVLMWRRKYKPELLYFDFFHIVAKKNYIGTATIIFLRVTSKNKSNFIVKTCNTILEINIFLLREV